MRADRDTYISGATGSSYTIEADQLGKRIAVHVLVTDDLGIQQWVKSAATAPVSAADTPATGAPTISGTAQVGETLTANTSGIADADGLENATFSYQWLADDAEIPGATGSTYTLTDSEESKAITVQVSFTDDADNQETLTSAGDGRGGRCATHGAAGQAQEALRHGFPRFSDSHLGRPRRQHHHRLRDPAARPRERYRGRL